MSSPPPQSTTTVDDGVPPLQLPPPPSSSSSSSSADTISSKLEKMNISSASFSIWPPTQRTRDAVASRLIDTLSSPSVLSKRYGTLPLSEAETIARQIEEAAFSAASSSATSATAASIDDGIEILQAYSKEISKRMLDAVKSRAEADTPPPPADVSPTPETITEEASSVDNE